MSVNTNTIKDKTVAKQIDYEEDNIIWGTTPKA